VVDPYDETEAKQGMPRTQSVPAQVLLEIKQMIYSNLLLTLH